MLGTFLNPLTYLFGRVGRGSGKGNEVLITGLVSLVFHCLPSTFTVLFVCLLRVGCRREQQCAGGLRARLRVAVRVAPDGG